LLCYQATEGSSCHGQAIGFINNDNFIDIYSGYFSNTDGDYVFLNDGLDLSTHVNGDTIFASQDSAIYQWVDCNNSFTPIAGDTNQYFIASAGGDYAVIISYKGCTDTSACVNMVVTSLGDQNEQFDIEIYPNPNNGIFKLQISNFESDVEIRIMNVHGQVIRKEELMITSSSYIKAIDLSGLPKGIYFIQFKSNNFIKTKKLILE
jgi:hypothetical protein